MKVYYECGPCFLRQAKEALDLSTDDEELKFDIIKEIFNLLSNDYLKGSSSNEIGSKIHNLIKERTGCDDPYKSLKIKGNNLALKYIDKIVKSDSLEDCVKIAIIGNMLDFGAFKLDDDVEEFLKNSLNKELAINDVESLEEDLIKYDKLLYFVDNTGEIVFDKFLLEKIKSYDVEITIVVKDKPILNDACLRDALEVGLDNYGKIITMAPTVGIVYKENNDEFKEIFDSYDLIISKGMGNFEGFTELNLENKNLYYLLIAKCSAISKYIGVNLNDFIFLKSD